MMVPQNIRQGLLTLAEDSGSPVASGRGSPELAISREGLPTHRLYGAGGAMFRSPARSLAISLPDPAAKCKDGAHQSLAFTENLLQKAVHGVRRSTTA